MASYEKKKKKKKMSITLFGINFHVLLIFVNLLVLVDHL